MIPITSAGTIAREMNVSMMAPGEIRARLRQVVPCRSAAFAAPFERRCLGATLSTGVARVIGLHFQTAEPRGTRLPLSFRKSRTGSQRRGFAMKFVLASWVTRGDVEPCAAVGPELLR